MPARKIEAPPAARRHIARPRRRRPDAAGVAPRPQRRDAGDRREQVLRTAERLFARHGYGGVGLREIAREVGIRAPSLFKHFPSKQAIYNLVLGDLFRALAEAIDAGIRGPGSYPDRLDRLVIAYIDFLVARPHFPAILFRETLDHPQAIEEWTSARGVAIYRRLDAFLRAGRRAGAFRAVSARHLILGFTGMVTFFHASQSEVTRLDAMVGGRRHELRRWKEEVVDTMRRALLSDAASTSTADRATEERGPSGARASARDG
ncbi:MAG TPA: TetR/AcrR family transcriptional regulator [Candidatus Binatia bacterium]|nr:TetR/AcrR family transcriptional regulator [Candidatus Binatia bacterium]